MTARAGGTGIAVAARNLAEALEARGDVDLVRLFPPWAAMSTPRRIWWDQLGLPREASRRGARLLHHFAFSCSWWSDLPRVITLHDLLALEFPGECPTLSARLFWRHLLPRSLAWADRVVCVSEASRQALARLGPRLKAAPGVALQALPAERSRPATVAEVAVVRRRYSLPPRFLLGVASALPRKDLPTLVQAHAQVAARPGFEDLGLVLAGGGGPHQATVAAAVAASPARLRVRSLGWVPDADLPALYQAAAAFVFPSRGEGFGFPALEAMAQGTPVVAAAATSLPEVAGEAASWFPPGDAAAAADRIAEVLADPARAAALVSRGRRRLRRFTWQATAAAYVRVYRELLGPG